MSLNFKSQRTEKIEFLSQGTKDSKHLSCETLYIANYRYVNNSSLAVLDIKLLLEEDDDFTNINLYIHSN